MAETKATKAEKPSKESKGSSSKYYTNFDFFYKRTCFRIMTLFFKLKFKPFLDSW